MSNMPYSSDLNVALWVPRFWPAIGGTELHTFTLAQQLSNSSNVSVITHCDENENPLVGLPMAAALSHSSVNNQGTVLVQRTGFKGVIRQILGAYSRLYSHQRWSRPLYSFLLKTALRQQIALCSQEADVIHFIYNGLTESAVMAANTAERRNIPFVFTPNVLDTTTQKSAWNSALFKRLYLRATRIIALTQHEADWLVSNGAPSNKISVIPYGPILSKDPDAAAFKEQYNLGKSRIILFLGRLTTTKGYDMLLDAAHKVWRQVPDAQFLFIGPADAQARARLAAAPDPRILLLDGVSQQTKANAIAACDVMCVPSKAESLGVVYIEAAYCSKPVVALNLPVLHHVVENNKTGLLVEHSAHHVSTALCSLLSDPDRCRLLGYEANKLARQRFDWKVVCEQVLAEYKKALQEYRFPI